MDQNKLLRAIARIHAYGRPVDFTKPFLAADRFKGVGTGFFIHPPTPTPTYLYVLTCAHVVDSADTVTIMLPLLGLSEYTASVLGLVPGYDIAVLAVPVSDSALLGQASPLTLGKSDSLKLGQKLTAVGYPLGQTAIKVSDGVYAGFQEKLQHTVSISPGNSGGPLMTEDGLVVGINSSGILSPEASNVGFAVPIEMFSLMSTPIFAQTPGPPSPERVIRLPMFGFEFAPITRSHSRAVGASTCSSTSYEGGVQITSIIPGSSMGSMSPGDILVEFDGMAIDTIGEMDVPWNYQKVRLQDVLVRCVEGREYEIRVWKQDSGSCMVKRVKPRPSMSPSLRLIYPPYDRVPYMIVLGLVIMPLLGNHLFAPTVAKTYMCKKPTDLANPCLIIAHVFNGTLAQIEGPLHAGDEVSHVNDVKVNTLEDVLASLCKFTTINGSKVLTVKTKNGKVFMVNTLDALQSEERASVEKIYTPEPTLLKYLSVERTS